MSETIRQTINRLGVPKTTIATLSDISCQELSLFFRDPSQVSAVKQDRIRKTVEEIRQFLDEDWLNAQAGLPLPFPLDLRDALALRKWMDFARDVRTQADSEAVNQMQKVFETLGAKQ